METCNIVLTFQSVENILWCVHSNKIPLAVLSRGTICFAGFERMKFWIFLEFLFSATARSEKD